MAIKKISYEQGREQWLELRKQYLGGSDAAAVLGLSKWSSPLSVYADKLGLVPEREDNEAMRQGRDLEAYVAKRFCEATGLKVRRENHILVNDAYPFMCANIDRKIIGVDEGLECKTTSVYNKTDFAGGDVPHEYYVQCCHYLAVTGWQRWHLAVLVLNKGFYTFTIERNEADIQALINVEHSFYEQHLLPQIPPEPTEHDGELLSTLYPVSDAHYVPLNHISGTLALLVEAKKQLKSLESEVSQYENLVKAELQDAFEGSDGRFAVSWNTRRSTRFNTTVFRREFPQLYNDFLIETSSRTFLIKDMNKENHDGE